MEKLPLQLLQVVSLRHCWQVGNRPFDVQSSTKHCPFRHPSHEQHQQRNCFSTHAKRRQSHHHRRCYSTVLEALDRTLHDILEEFLRSYQEISVRFSQSFTEEHAPTSSTPPSNHHPSGPIFNYENFKPTSEPNLPKLRETNSPTY